VLSINLTLLSVASTAVSIQLTLLARYLFLVAIAIVTIIARLSTRRKRLLYVISANKGL
jgi:hypothetical protein